MRRGLIVIGRVSRPHGVKGEIRIEYFNPGLHFFSQYSSIVLQGEAGDLRSCQVIVSRPHKKAVIVTLEGVRTREEAEKLRGDWVLVDTDELPATEEDEYYWYEIVGMQVFTEAGRYIGEVEQIVPTGSNDVYVVRREEKEFLIPATKHVVVDIDRETNKIVIHPLEGLLQDNDL